MLFNFGFFRRLGIIRKLRSSQFCTLCHILKTMCLVLFKSFMPTYMRILILIVILHFTKYLLGDIFMIFHLLQFSLSCNYLSLMFRIARKITAWMRSLLSIPAKKRRKKITSELLRENFQWPVANCLHFVKLTLPYIFPFTTSTLLLIIPPF